MSSTEFANDQFDAWVDERFEEVRTAALVDLGRGSADYTAALNIIGNKLLDESERNGRPGGGRHLQSVD